MTEYGPNSGVVPFTGWTPTLGTDQTTLPVASGSVAFNGMTQADGRLSSIMRRRGNRALRELYLTLLAGASGDAAAESYSRVKQRSATDALNPQMGGGLVTLETVTQIGRNTASADVTNTVAAMSRNFKPSSYVADLSGNGASHIAGW